MIRFLPALLCASAASAQPMFDDRSDALPEHIYSGGWEHFVGGGLAILDCNSDGRPDIFAAGGTSPAILIRNDGDFRFTPAELPQITGATGAYPIDMDADGVLDLFVLRVGQNRILKGLGDCKFSDTTEVLGLPADNQWSTAFTAWWEGDNTRPTLAIGNYVDRDNPDGPFEACDTNTILRPTPEGYVRDVLKPGFCPLSMLAAT